MSFSISDAFVLQFGTNVRYLAQQQKSRLQGRILQDQVTGERAYLEQVAPTAAVKVTARHADSPIMNTQHLRRTVSPYDYAWGDLIDREDRVRLLIEPEGVYSQNASYAMSRAYDDEGNAAAFGTAYSGHTGSTALAWPNGNSETTPSQPAGTVVAVNDWTYGTGSGNVGLTVSKLISAMVALDAAEGDEDEDRFIMIGAKQKGNMLATTEATSADYNSVRALVEGKLNSYMGFQTVHSERLLLDANGYTRVMAWRKSALGMGMARDIAVMAAPRPDKRFSQYVYADQSIGGARLEEAKLVEIKCL
jgi:hypothetical protein